MSATPWPRLSATLSGPRAPDRCQGCGADEDLSTWEECGDFDQPDQVYVVLCQRCARQVDPHPRLYHRLDRHRPLPGVMVPLCLDCRYRDGTRCTHAALVRNGGSGLAITAPQPTTGFFCGRGRNGKRTSGAFALYPGPATACAGKKPGFIRRDADAPSLFPDAGSR